MQFLTVLHGSPPEMEPPLVVQAGYRKHINCIPMRQYHNPLTYFIVFNDCLYLSSYRGDKIYNICLVSVLDSDGRWRVSRANLAARRRQVRPPGPRIANSQLPVYRGATDTAAGNTVLSAKIIVLVLWYFTQYTKTHKYSHILQCISSSLHPSTLSVQKNKLIMVFNI